MAIHIIEGSVRDHREALQPLLEAHVAELTTHPDLMTLSPDWSRYEQLEDDQRLITLYAFGDQDLIGYACTILTPHLHYSDLYCAHNDVLFVRPDYRRTAGVGLKLIAQTELLAAARGAQVMTWHAKPSTPLALLLAARHYGIQDLIFLRELH